MVEIRKANIEDAPGIVRVCSEGYRTTYPDLLPQDCIEKIIRDFYYEERVMAEICNVSREWNGWFVAVDAGQVVGAGGGGFTAEDTAELFVLYLDPERKREGIGSRLLEAITADQLQRGAREQWVSVAKGNRMAIPFYEAVGFRFRGERPAYGLPEEDGFVSLRYRRALDSDKYNMTGE